MWKPAIPSCSSAGLPPLRGTFRGVCCDHINFFTSHTTAEAWASAHPEITGGILSQTRALEAARQISAQLLRLSESELAGVDERERRLVLRPDQASPLARRVGAPGGRGRAIEELGSLHR